MKALSRFSKIYERRLEEPKEKGNFVGYPSCYVPFEIIRACGAYPLRIIGDMRKPPYKADAHLETIMCSHLRNFFSLFFIHFLDAPHMVHNGSSLFFSKQIELLFKKPSELRGKRGELSEAVKLHNRIRGVLRELYGLRKRGNPPITGVEESKESFSLLPLEVDYSLGEMERFRTRVQAFIKNNIKEVGYGYT